MSPWHLQLCNFCYTTRLLGLGHISRQPVNFSQYLHILQDWFGYWNGEYIEWETHGFHKRSTNIKLTSCSRPCVNVSEYVLFAPWIKECGGIPNPIQIPQNAQRMLDTSPWRLNAQCVSKDSQTKWEQEPQSGTRMGTKSEQSGNKNPKVGQEWEQSGNKVGTRGVNQRKEGNLKNELCKRFCKRTKFWIVNSFSNNTRKWWRLDMKFRQRIKFSFSSQKVVLSWAVTPTCKFATQANM